VPDPDPKLSPPDPPDPSVEAWAFTVPETIEDEVTGLVWSLGCTGITIEKAPSEAVRLVCFFADPDLPEAGLRGLALRFSTIVRRIQVPNPDWVQRFRETFVAFDAPPFLVVPEWVDETEGAEPAASSPPPSGRGRFRIRVDPGRAFGTGIHESTKLCLRTLGTIAVRLPPSPRTLDLGCGTGILGIGAIKLVTASVVACDHDPLAAASAGKHAALNNVRLDILLMDGCRGLAPERFDLVFANLMAPFLISRAAEISAVGAPGCRYILAGLLRDEESAVRAAWPRDWPVAAAYQGDWACLLYERP